MPGPWEKYAAPAASGPWEKYGAAPPAPSSTPVVHGDRLKGTPTNLPDNFMGTLAKDFANFVPGTVTALAHPIDTVRGAFQQLVNLPGDVMTDISQGNWGKLGAKFAELAVPALSTERGAAVAAEAGNVAKGAIKATGAKVAEVAANPVARELIGVASPRLKNALAAVNRVKTAAQQAAAEDAVAIPAAAAETPGMALARESGADWAKLSPTDQAMLEQVAKARANVAAQPARPPMGPPQAEAAPVVDAQPVEHLTAAQEIQREFANRQAEAEAQAPAVALGGHDTTPAPFRGAPVRPPLRTANPPEPAQVAPTPPEPTAPPQAPPPSMAQAEAWMARKNPAPIENTQTRTNPDGSSMSPQMRGAVRTAANTAAKADRWAPVLHKFGITAEDLPNINPGQWEQVLGAMKQQGFLEAGETAPKSSIPEIAKRLKALEKGTVEEKAAISPAPETPAQKPARTEVTAELVGSSPITTSRKFMGTETIKSAEPDKFFVPYTNPSAKPGAGMRFSLVETEGTNGARRLNAYRAAIPEGSIEHAPPDASALVRNGAIESVYVNQDWRGSGLYKQFRTELSRRGLEVSPDNPKSASYLAAESKFGKPSAAPDLSSIPVSKLQSMKFEELRALFPKGTPKAQISQAIAEAMHKAMTEQK